MKKTISISPSNAEYVQSIAKQVSDPRSVKGNFSKGLKKIIEDHKGGKNV